MPVFKYFAFVGSALLGLLFISDAYFGDSETNSRFNGSLYESAIYAPRLVETVATEELRFTRDVTPPEAAPPRLDGMAHRGLPPVGR
jgi:hypothetical protein